MKKIIGIGVATLVVVFAPAVHAAEGYCNQVCQTRCGYAVIAKQYRNQAACVAVWGPINADLANTLAKAGNKDQVDRIRGK